VFLWNKMRIFWIPFCYLSSDFFHEHLHIQSATECIRLCTIMSTNTQSHTPCCNGCNFITVWWNCLIFEGLLHKWLILMFIILVSLYFVKSKSYEHSLIIYEQPSYIETFPWRIKHVKDKYLQVDWLGHVHALLVYIFNAPLICQDFSKRFW